MTQKNQSDKRHPGKPLFLGIAVFLFSCICWTLVWAESLEEQQLVEKAKHTVDSFANDQTFTWFHKHAKDAKALVIVPQQLKAAFFLGVDGGSGVLVARDEETGQWSEPVFYVLGGLSIGAQFGGEASEVIIMAMTQGALEKLYSSSFKLGGDISYAVGPHGGAGVEGATSANLNADFLSFSRSKGVYLGVSLEGSIISVDDGANEAYYGKKVRPIDILVTKSVKNKHSSGLRQAITTAFK